MPQASGAARCNMTSSAAWINPRMRGTVHMIIWSREGTLETGWTCTVRNPIPLSGNTNSNPGTLPALPVPVSSFKALHESASKLTPAGSEIPMCMADVMHDKRRGSLTPKYCIVSWQVMVPQAFPNQAAARKFCLEALQQAT